VRKEGKSLVPPTDAGKKGGTKIPLQQTSANGGRKKKKMASTLPLGVKKKFEGLTKAALGKASPLL